MKDENKELAEQQSTEVTELVDLSTLDLSTVDFTNAIKNDKTFVDTKNTLADTKLKFQEVPDCATTQGYEDCKEALGILVPLRTGLEKHRQKIRDPFLNAQKIIKSEADLLSEQIVEFETPFKQAKTAEDDAIKERKAEKARQLAAKLLVLTDAPKKAENMTSSEIRALIGEIEAFSTEINFGKDKPKAIAAKSGALDRLEQMLENKVAAENLEVERQEREAVERKAEQDKKIDGLIIDIKDIALKAMDVVGRDQLMATLEILDDIKPSKVQHGDRHVEIAEALDQSKARVQKMIDAFVEPAPEDEIAGGIDQDQAEQVETVVAEATDNVEAVETVLDDVSEIEKETDQYTEDQMARILKLADELNEDGPMIIAMLFDEMTDRGLFDLPVYKESMNALEAELDEQEENQA